MTSNEAAVLARLSPMAPHRPAWRKPTEFGATANSHHVVTATRMIAKGWVERQQRPRQFVDGPRRRPSWEYRITALGSRALANHVMLKSLVAA